MSKDLKTIADEFKKEIKWKLETIFCLESKELVLELNKLNLLEDKNNCIKSSTAIGFCVEEFISVKLINFNSVPNKDGNNLSHFFKFQRNSGGTTQNSYDLFVIYENIKIMVNIKLDNGHNNAIAAIQKLYNDYTRYDEDLGVKCNLYNILKIKYEIFNKKIIIKDILTFFIEEINFESAGEIKQDSRNWTKNYNGNSGRIQISPMFFKKWKKEINDDSHINFKNFLDKIYKKNKKEKR